MKKLLLLLSMAILVSCSSKEAAIPDSIVGVWATEGSKLKGEFLFEGHAFYLDKYGKGAIVGGPPAIGFEVKVAYNKNSNLLSYQANQNEKIVGQYKYDKKSGLLIPQEDINNPLSKRYSEFSDSTKKALGLQ